MYENMSLPDVLNDLRARELAVVMQYMRHHYLATGPDGLPLAGEFKDIAIAEMKHAEALAERIDILGGDPTTKAEQIMGLQAESLSDMASADRDSEMDAVNRYKDAIKLASQSEDPTTRTMLEEILAQEEEHLKTFGDMLSQHHIMAGAAK